MTWLKEITLNKHIINIYSEIFNYISAFIFCMLKLKLLFYFVYLRRFLKKVFMNLDITNNKTE